MKTVRKIHTGQPNCSCTSCIYKGESENASVKRFIAHGSRIDRLYYGKYIPLRERKLLERLVRTRAVYDDIRARLLSDSTHSLSTRASKKSSRELDDVEKGSGAVFELVNLVDKGATLGLSECCSCCSCDSKGIRGNVRHMRHGAHGFERRMFEEGRIAETHRRRKGVRFTKHIRSDPCTCTAKLSAQLKHHATEIFKRRRRPASTEFYSTTDEERQSRQRRVRDFVHRSYENIKHVNKEMEQKFLEGVKKVKESKAKMQENLQLDTQYSAVQLRQARRKQKSKGRGGQKRQSKKSDLKLNDLLAICMCPEDEIFETPHESLLSVYTKKSKEKILEAKEKVKSIVKSTISRKPKVRKIATKSSQIEMAPEQTLAAQLKKQSVICICPEEQEFVKQHRGTARKTSTRTSETHFPRGKDLALQVKKDSLVKFKEDLIRKQIMKDWECGPECIEGPCDPEECLLKLERKRRNKGVKHRGVEYQQIRHQKKTGPVLQHKHAKIQEESIILKTTGKQKPILRNKQIGGLVEHIESGERFNKKQKNKTIDKREMLDKRQSPDLKTHEKKLKARQGVRISSSFALNVEFFKEVPKTEIPKENPKESVLNQSPSGINYKIIKKPKTFQDEEISQVVTKHSSRDTQTRIRSLKRCFCTLKLKSRAVNRKRNRVATLEKSIFTNTSSVTPCSINCSTEMCEKLLCEKLFKKSSKVQTYTPKRHKNKRRVKPRQLLPYECEPGVCIPGECDPYQCIQLINLREVKTRKRSMPCSTCTSRKTRSTSTFTSKSNKPSKSKFVQSMFSYNATQRRNETKLKLQQRNETEMKLQQRNIPVTHGRQAVRIGSTFSFNIEFYKNRPEEYLSHPPHLKTLSIQPKYKAIPKRKKVKERGFQGDAISFYRDIPTQMYRKEKHKSMSTSLKRCFCTLKLQKKQHLKMKKNKMLTIGTRTMDELYFEKETSNKATKTKQKYFKLKPYECEPFTCIPGECNPYECLERINRRHLRDIGVTSFKYPEISTGSSTSERTFRSAIIQSNPKSKPKKVFTKGKQFKQYPKATMNENYSNYSSSARSRQAVRVGSKISFNVEFYKEKPYNDVMIGNQAHPALKFDSRPDTRNRGVKGGKFNVADLDTQMEPKYRNKASTTKPLLKRCFCTLNLQKRKGYVIPPNVFTVNTAIMNENRFSIFKPYRSNIPKFTKSAKLNEKNYNLSNFIMNSLSKCNIDKNIENVSCKRCYSMITNECKRGTLKLISQTYVPHKDLNCRKVSHEQFVTNKNSPKYIPQVIQESISYTSKNYEKSNTAVEGNPYLKSCFCTMNLQIQTNNMDMRNQKRGNRYRKLKPYECEPGVCVPGECDPYECLKLISKRGSNYTRKTGTENTVASESSYTNLAPKYKSYKVQSPSEKMTNPHLIEYEDHHKSGSKKAVRLASKFSFDVEFSKKSPGAQLEQHDLVQSTISKPTPTHLRRLSKITGMNNMRYRDRPSQSTLSKTFQKASATLPMMKRCFCTLKLQKKGRLLRHDYNKPTEALQTEPITPQITTMDRGQNTGKFKPIKLAPYECMPGICSPGECNPYECLEIMKKMNRNQTVDFGINALGPRSRSVGSMYDFYGRNKNRGVNVRHKVANRPTFYEGRQRQGDQQAHLIKPERQVVRIGSSFSFDIEFHKGSASAHPKVSREDHMSDSKNRYVESRERSLETVNPRHHKKLQIKDRVHAASTMTTSFMKRCFCVLKLRKNNKGIMNEINEENIPKPVYVDKKINTRRYKEPVLQLEPYECEPGICVPGECDPYVCEKLIRQRMQSTASGTPLRFTRSVSSNSPRSYMRHVNTQFHPRKKIGDVKRQVYTKTRIQDSNRQVVRIGSNFRFDIEFYKNNAPNHSNGYVPKAKTDERVHFERKKGRGRSTGTYSHFPSFKSDSSQVNVNKRDFGAGLNNVLKRCFCTLQLYNQRSKKYMARKPKEPIKTEVHSKSVMTTERHKLNYRVLEPYECEPNFCIPYQCDPYECEQRIRKRNLRNTGMFTQLPGTHSVASYTKPYGRSRKRTQSNMYKNQDRFKRPKTQKTIHNTQSKQCVRIGSNFSFDIEFFKNKGGGLQLDQKPKYIKPRQSLKQFARGPRRVKARTKGLQSLTPFNAKESQIDNEFTNTQSTMARLAQPLKRCFCTFALKKNKARTNPLPKPVQINASTETIGHEFKLQPLSKLLPYECEPNFCVPNECNPLECLERIKARQRQQKNYGTSTNYLQKHRIGTSMGTPHTRNKGLQWKSLGHAENKKMYNRPLTSKPDKQVVKIGSNFSFSLEFYKQKGLDGVENNISDHNKSVIHNRRPLHAVRTQKADKWVNNMHDGYKMMRSHGAQSPHVYQESKGSGIEPFLKRCFCTLKLQKKPFQQNPNITTNNVIRESKPRSLTIDRGTITKKYRNYPKLSPYECEPNTCIPGECNPYECLQRIKDRYTRNMTTQIKNRYCSRGICTDLANLKSKKLQSNRFGDIVSATGKPNFVEVPRFENLLNPQAVKIGSNFSFNLEFYKELLPPNFETKDKGGKFDEKYYEATENIPIKKYNTNAVMACPRGKCHSIGSQGYRAQTDNKAVEIGNALKRCFCTLKLQKELNSNKINPNNQNAPFPQVFEVRRVGVQNKKRVKKTLKEVNSVGTKTKAKYLQKNNNEEMEVIHPYSPKKFNKSRSKAKFDKPKIKNKITPKTSKLKNRGKRLTKKKSKRALRQIASPSKQSSSKFQKLMCKCAQIFTNKGKFEKQVTTDKMFNKKNQTMNSTNKKSTKVGDAKTAKDDFYFEDGNYVRCHDTCAYYMDTTVANKTQLNPTISIKIKKKHKKIQIHDYNIPDKKSRNAISKSEHQKTTHNSYLCQHCENIKMKKQRSQPLKVHFQDSPIIEKKLGKKANDKDGLTHLNKSVDQINSPKKASKNKKIRNEVPARKTTQYCKFCTNCGTKLNNEEIQKASGDQKSVKNDTKDNNVLQSRGDKIKNVLSTSDKVSSTSDKIKNLFNFNQSVDNICSAKGPEPPLFEMKLDSDDYGILNKDEIIDKVRIYSKKTTKETKGKSSVKGHGQSCRCCICLAKRNKVGAAFTVSGKDSKPTGKPCVCGSIVCAEKLEKMTEQLPTRSVLRHPKPCECGSPVCARESIKISLLTAKGDVTCICAEEAKRQKKKLKRKKDRLEDEKRAKRLKIYKKEDRIRCEKRKKENKLMEKKINKNASDTILFAESLIDVGKLGITAFTDILRLFVRTAVDPKHAYQKLQDMKNDPHLLAKYLKSGVKDSGAMSTCRRIRLRCLSMRGVKKVRSLLESHPLTNYLLYIASNDPKRRIAKRRALQREQIDFSCSLYMGSLRKRPFLSVYNKYPWFYPHFLSLLNVWKQFTDIALFLLAVVVWSPCILCMEGCRAIMCCFFCTG